MQTQVVNPCVRCGKPRIDAKTWKEYVGKSLVIFTKTVCPDSDCQKIVDREIEERRIKKEMIMNSKSKKVAVSPQG